MESLRILLFFGYVSFIFAYVSSVDYFDEKLRQTKIEIAKLYFRDEPPVQRRTYNVKWNQRNFTWSGEIYKDRPFILNMYDKIFLIETNRFVAFSLGDSSSNHTSLPGIIPSLKNSVKFVRNIIWKGVFYLLICYESGSCNIYTFDNLQLKYRQTIRHKGYPMDASFFVRANRLYLVVANNIGPFSVPSLIYHWRDTYMDKIEEVMTIAAISVTTFKHKQSTIIVFAQSSEDVPGIGSMVYEFKETSVDTIQFLETSDPFSAHHYRHMGFNFILLINENTPSSLHWWDGHELLTWQQISEIRAPSLVRVVNINDDTFFFVTYDNIVQLYKFENASDCILINTAKLPAGTIIDVQTRIDDKSTIIMMLSVMNSSLTYRVELWELFIEEIPSEYSNKASDILSKHLAELVEILQQRKHFVEEAKALWPLLRPVHENSMISEFFDLPNLILDSGIVKNIDIFVDGDIIAPSKLEQRIANLIHEIDNVLSSNEYSMLNNTNSLNGNIIVDGDAFIEQLQIDKMIVDFLNDIYMHNPNEMQELPVSLKKRNIIVNDLKVGSICGIPYQYWSLINDTSKMKINLRRDEIEFSNNTIYLNSSISLKHLDVKILNGTDINELFKELFIINYNQRIKGKITYNNTLQIQNFTIQVLNGKSWNNYMNARTDQKFNNFIVRKLRVKNLYTDSINGVPISEAARISIDNIIKGKTKIAKLQVTKELVVNPRFNLLQSKPNQIYSNVTIHGNLKIGTLELDKYTRIFLNNEEINLKNIFDTFWTKSTDQIIENDVTFGNSLIIDCLNAKYLNGFSEEEFLYTTAKIIPESFRTLHFENVHVDDMLFIDGKNDNFFEIAPESIIIIRERLHLKHLCGNQLLTDTFNGLLVADILSRKQPYIFPQNMNFLSIKVKRINVDELTFPFSLQNTKNDSKSQKTKFMKTPEFHVENLNVENINNLEVKRLLSLKNMKISDLKDLIIHGDLTIKIDLKVIQIDDQPSMIYIKNMDKGNVLFNNNNNNIQELIAQNITLKSLHNHDTNNFFENFLSKSRKQNISGRFTFYKITTDNVKTSFINHQNVSKLAWIDKPLSLMKNIEFDDLFVEGNTITKTLNKLNVNELYENMLNISIPKINNLKVDGNISWDVSSTSSAFVTLLFENAVTKTTYQIIRNGTIFQGNVSVSTITGQCKEVDEIRNIIEDTVIIDDNDIEIIGQKSFKENLHVDAISVTDDINIPTINNINILEFNNSVVWKNQKEPITGIITFLDDVTMDQILVDDKVHDVLLKGVVLTTDKLPNHVYFKDLVILEDVYLKTLDEINFDEFLKDRVTIDEEHELLANIQFNDTVEIIESTNLSRINGIYPSDLVLNNGKETQVITGSKIFEENIIINNDIYGPIINDVNVSLEYCNGIQNDEDVEIIGDLVFESEVKVPENVFVFNLMNGINLTTISYDLQKEINRTLYMFARNETKIEKSIGQSVSISKNLGNIFSYLETEEKLKIQTPNIKKIDVVYYEQITKLNIFGEEPGSLCGLPDNCFCTTEYMAEFTENDCHIRKINGSKIIRNYHELHSTFGINVISNAMSYSRECSLNNSKNEFITISWTKPGMIDTVGTLASVKETPLEIQGFIKDAKFFTTHDNAAFIVLAVYYDILRATHRTDSVIYKIDLENNNLSLHQNISTDGAWTIDIFKANHRNVYLLLGCFGNSKKSYLYKLDPITSKFTIIRSFKGKTRNVKSLIQERDCFVLLDDFETNAINIFYYDPKFDNFYNYQSLFHDSRINGIESFYTNDFGQSDSFVIVTTEDDQFYVYEYMLVERFQLKIHHRIHDLQTMVPFYHLGNYYIFTGTSTNSTILRIIRSQRSK